MSRFLCCTVTQYLPLDPGQMEQLNAIIVRYNNNPDIVSLVGSDGGLCPLITEFNETLKICIKDPENLVLIDHYDYAYVMENWLHLFSEMRKFMARGEWKIQMDESVFPWSEDTQKFGLPDGSV